MRRRGHHDPPGPTLEEGAGMVQAIHNLVSAPTCTEVLASTAEHHSPTLTVSCKTLKAVQELPAQVGGH